MRIEELYVHGLDIEDVRYMVLPMHQPDTEHLSEEELAQLATRDSLIGVDVSSYRSKRAGNLPLSSIRKLRPLPLQ